jgi:predicted ATPase
LAATLDWSYRLLSRDDARLFELLSVFPCAFTLDDVVFFSGHFGRPPEDIAASLESLAAKSLVSVAYGPGGLRYRLLGSTRCFAAERLLSTQQNGAAVTA